MEKRFHSRMITIAWLTKSSSSSQMHAVFAVTRNTDAEQLDGAKTSIPATYRPPRHYWWCLLSSSIYLPSYLWLLLTMVSSPIFAPWSVAISTESDPGTSFGVEVVAPMVMSSLGEDYILAVSVWLKRCYRAKFCLTKRSEPLPAVVTYLW